MTDRLNKQDWEVRHIPQHFEAENFIRLMHYSRSCPNTSTYRHGLYRTGEFFSLVQGVGLWIPPTRTAAEAIAGDDWEGVLALSRFCVAPEVPRNGASFLLGRSMRMIDRRRWPVLVSWADTNEGHTGAIYLAANWKSDGEVAAGDVWTTPDGQLVGRKRGRFTLTKTQMQDRGYVRRPSAAKIRFVHTVQ